MLSLYNCNAMLLILVLLCSNKTKDCEAKRLELSRSSGNKYALEILADSQHVFDDQGSDSFRGRDERRRDSRVRLPLGV
jgi:hypothetical protein